MIQIIKNVLNKEQCDSIIKSSESLPPTRWHTIQQNNNRPNTIKCYIKPHITEILKQLPLDIDDTTAVEVVKYQTGSCNDPHMDIEGTHSLALGKHIIAEWKQTAIILLNDNYQGGELYFPKVNHKFDNSSIGDLIIFPAGKDSFDYSHEVTEVTSGTRYTLVFRFI
jgi:predicted 2-oxoglutarate/Fe(II)-dependent dioxygenase YbiX